ALKRHALRAPPAQRPLPGRERQAAGRGDAQRHAVRGHPDDRLPARGAPAAGRLRPGARGAATVAGRPGGAGAGRVSAAPYRLAATDLDGTVIRTDGTVSRRNCEAMRGAESAATV